MREEIQQHRSRAEPMGSPGDDDDGLVSKRRGAGSSTGDNSGGCSASPAGTFSDSSFDSGIIDQ